MKLKTLKDLENRTYCEHPEDKCNPEVCGECLKQEAIKWVKELAIQGRSEETGVLLEFFNITEEDLK